MTEPSWSLGARHRLQGRRLVIVGIGVDQMRGFAEAGGDICGAIEVLPASSPTLEPDEAFEVLLVEGRDRDILDHVVSGYARALSDHAPAVGGFLDGIDPDGSAAVASYLPLPHAALGGREAWAADALVSLPLEEKRGAETPLADVVDVIPTITVPNGPPGEWWRHVCELFDADRLVLQAPGITGGGTGTHVCSGPDEVPDGARGHVAPFVDGIPGNVMGVVDDAAETLVLPATRQLVRHERGQPLYAGNVTGDSWTVELRSGIEAEVRRLGRRLAELGFFGPFGVDFVLDRNGRRWYHDLNPRMNGVVDSLAPALAELGDVVALTPLLLSRPLWNPDDRRALEDDLHAAAMRNARARLWLTTVTEHGFTVEHPPVGGRYRLERDPLRLLPLHDSVDAPSGSVVELQPLLPPGLELVPGDRLALGNLYCDSAIADDLVPLGPALIDAALG